MSKTETKREVWWATPPAPGQNDSDVEWGYLVWFSDGSFDFQIDPENPPSPEEIANRESCRYV